MFGTSRRLSALEARVSKLEQETEPGELERLRGSVLNALRALRRTQTAQEAREAKGQGSNGPDYYDRVLATRRGQHGVL
jgi:hypothetical protein